MGPPCKRHLSFGDPISTGYDCRFVLPERLGLRASRLNAMCSRFLLATMPPRLHHWLASDGWAGAGKLWLALELLAWPLYAGLAILGLRRSAWFLVLGIAAYGIASDSW